MFLRTLVMLALAVVAVSGCASTPGAPDVRLAIRNCSGEREGGACRQLVHFLLAGEVPRSLAGEAEEVLLNACWDDSLVEARLGTDARYRLCYDTARHYSARAVQVMDEPETRFRKIAATLYLRACELGQPQGCRLMLSECLMLEEAMCHAPPSEDQARAWAEQRRERDYRMRLARER
jgi:hypothetical protein